MVEVVCSRCGGIGTLLFYTARLPDCRLIGQEEQCPECGGAGRVQELSFEERRQSHDSESFDEVPQGAPYPQLDPVEIRTYVYVKGLTQEDLQYLTETADALDAAHRLNKTGAESDEPEGAIYLQMSDTLARHIATKLREIAHGID